MLTKEEIAREVESLNEECCEKCKFWDIQQDVFNPESGVLIEGLCLRYPPKQHSYDILASDLDSGDNFAHPTTIDCDWCGEFVTHKGSIPIRVSRLQNTN